VTGASDSGQRPFLMPARTDLARMRASLAGVADPEQAWRQLVLRGDIPAGWLDDAERRFVHDPGDRYSYAGWRPTRDPAFAPAGAHPGRVDECALYAADVDGVAAAQTHARTLAARLAPWGAPAFHHVLWWTLPRERYDYASSDTRPGVSYALMFAFNAAFDASSSRSRGLPICLFGHARIYSEVWRQLAAAGAQVPGDSGVAALRGRPFAELADPFEPIAGIEAAGYATLEWIGATGAATGAVLLVAPRED
jgi:hypothetical protein